MTAKPIRILHLIASNFVGGPEKQILHHAHDLQGAGFEVWVGSFRDQPQRAEILEHAERAGLRTCEFASSGRFDLRPIRSLASFLKREGIQLLCTHGYKANTFGTFAKRLAGVPQIAFCRGWTAETSLIKVFEFFDRSLLQFSDHVVCVSEAQAEVLARRGRMKSKLSVVHNAVLDNVQTAPEKNREICKTRLGFAPDTPLIGAIGRLSEEKGQKYLVQASLELVRKIKNVKVVLLGEGRERSRLEGQVRELGLQEAVLMPGFQKDVATWMGALDVIVNCSMTEGMPNVILEALAAGTPVVATAVGGVPELIEDRVTGLLIRPADSDAIAHRIISLVQDPQFASEVSRAGQLSVKTKFSATRQRDSLLAIYSQVLNPGLRSGASVAKGMETENVAVPVKFVRESACVEALGANGVPVISVVIPVRNEEKHLGAVIENLLAQEYPPDRFEILVVDGNSTDNTARVVGEAARQSTTPIKLLSNPRQLSSAGRNVGVRHSSGELIVFIDGHCHIPSHQLLLNTARYFDGIGADCLCRQQPLTAPGSNWFQRVVANVRASVIGHGLDSSIYDASLEGFIEPTSSGASYRRDIFDRVGFYDEDFDACEDVEFNYRVFRAGLRSYINPQLTVQYHPRSSYSGLWAQMVRYGRGRCRFTNKHPQAFSLAQAIPPVFLLWLVVGTIGSMFSGSMAQIFLWSIGLYVTIVVATSIDLSLRHGWRHALTAPMVYLTIHIGLGYGFLVEAANALRSRCRAMLGVTEAHRNQTVFCDSTANRPESPKVQVSRGDQAADRLSSTVATERKRINAFTVDVEDYFHTEAMTSVVSREQWEHMPSRVQSSTLRVFELLGKYNVCGTFFFLGWVAERFPELVREALKLGHEVGCHSFWHRRVSQLSPSEFRDDTLRAKRAIEDAGGVCVRGYRAPSFSILPGTEWAFDILAELEFTYDSSVHPIRHDLYDNGSAPRLAHSVGTGKLLELPIATVRVGNKNLPVGGGGYLRILPYRYTSWGLRRFNLRDGVPGIMYMHPWEIDPEQPRLSASRKSRFRQYVGLDSMQRKLECLLRDFRFAPIATVLQKELSETLQLAPAGGSVRHAVYDPASESDQIANSVGPIGGR